MHAGAELKHYLETFYPRARCRRRAAHVRARSRRDQPRASTPTTVRRRPHAQRGGGAAGGAGVAARRGGRVVRGACAAEGEQCGRARLRRRTRRRRCARESLPRSRARCRSSLRTPVTRARGRALGDGCASSRCVPGAVDAAVRRVRAEASAMAFFSACAVPVAGGARRRRRRRRPLRSRPSAVQTRGWHDCAAHLDCRTRRRRALRRRVADRRSPPPPLPSCSAAAGSQAYSRWPSARRRIIGSIHRARGRALACRR